MVNIADLIKWKFIYSPIVYIPIQPTSITSTSSLCEEMFIIINISLLSFHSIEFCSTRCHHNRQVNSILIAELYIAYHFLDISIQATTTINHSENIPSMYFYIPVSWCLFFLLEATTKTINQMTTDIMKTSSTSKNGLTPSE